MASREFTPVDCTRTCERCSTGAPHKADAESGKGLQPLTLEEQDRAAKYLYLVDRFLYRNHLDPDEYYDIAIFGYLRAIQIDCRNKNYPAERRNFKALSEFFMKYEVNNERKRLNQVKRRADQLSFSLDDTPAQDGEAFSFHELVADIRMNTENTVINSDLIARALAAATPREREVIDYTCMGFSLKDVSALAGTTVTRVRGRLCKFRAKARAVRDKEEHSP